MPHKNIIVFSCDSQFFPLLKGAILSLESHNAFEKLSVDLGFIDIGCTDDELQWLKDRNAIIKPFNCIEDAIELGNKLAQYNKSQICRPYLPDIFKDHDNIIWCDSDIWFQTLDGLKIYVDLVNQYQKHVICSAFTDTYYTTNYSDNGEPDLLQYISLHYKWYEGCYGREIAERLKGKVTFNSGLFSMHRNSSFWHLWRRDLNIIYNDRVLSNITLTHLAEQTAFNKIIYETNRFIPVEARYNFNCHVGLIGSQTKNGKKEVRHSVPPHQVVDVIHLTMCSKRIKQYIDCGLLWDSGEYLSNEEKQRLLNIGHY